MTRESDRFKGVLSSLDPGADSALVPELAAELMVLAEELLQPEPAVELERAVWHRYLQVSGRPAFLLALQSRKQRYRWAETAFRAILRSHYSPGTLFSQRVRMHPERVLFREAHGDEESSWTYAQVARRMRTLAGLFCHRESEPRVAIFSENCIDSASCDLACLVHRIFDTPLNVHFDTATLVWIFDRLGINLAIADTEERLHRLAEVRASTARPFHIFMAGTPAAEPPAGVESLEEACARLNLEGIDELLEARDTRPLTSPATVMFTSGSTGAPKGIAFTPYQLVSKRFARAAALPSVGDHEVLLSYLPLFHTFGRYLELLGMVYWGGTYVLAGNPSAETLIAQFQEVRPTGLISVPLRWTQIRDHCLEVMNGVAGRPEQEAVFRDIVGSRLRWGLSAAGYLDPKVFRFFHRFGVELCSGFGMTEATGGITMTPPGEYQDGTVGIPLPGIQVRFGAQGELEIAGPYVARYLPDDGGSEILPQDPAQEYWLSTGDLFKSHPHGHLEIVDRIKDIYKNNRGQTIAPRRVEQKFAGVPGIKRVFLVGDGRDSNVLLIVPDLQDPVLQVPEANRREYFHQIVAAANVDLAPYERVVNFAVVERDFDIAHGELTPKGSLRRKRIEENFTPVIDKLYQANFIELICGDLRIRIPRWFFRDLGLLENDILAWRQELFVPSTGRRLAIVPRAESKTVLVGDLEYRITGPIVDLGLFARQPRLWVGNPALAAFCPCKDGWDIPTPSVSPQIRLPWRSGDEAPDVDISRAPSLRDTRLRHVHVLSMVALFAPDDAAAEAVERLSAELRRAGDRLASVIRRRLEALARHPAEQLRCLAYRILLTDEPIMDYSKSFPAFVESGLTFLSEESIRAIAHTGLGDKGLQALRRRLFVYRTQLQWPGSTVTRSQFAKIFDLLSNFARRDASYFAPVRAELASWALHRSDPELAAQAESRLTELKKWLEAELATGVGSAAPESKIVLDDGLGPAIVRRLEQIVGHPTFLKQSVMLAFDEEGFDLRHVPPSGIWVSPILAQHQFELYRVSINLRNGKHFDLLLVVGDDFSSDQVRDTLYWLMALSDHPSYSSMLPRFGACRPDLGVMSVAYISDLTVWEKIREYAGAQTVRSYFARRHDWRRLFVRGMSAFYTVWRASGSRIVPGAVTPANVVVPDADFREASCILSLTGWRTYESPLSLVLPFVRNFYRQTTAHYPKAAQQLEISWIFDACMETLGAVEGPAFLAALEEDLSRAGTSAVRDELREALGKYRQGLKEGPYLPLPLLCSLDRFADWEHANPDATPQAREEQVQQLYRLYRIDRFPEMFRYYLYSRTYFAHAGSEVHAAFERLMAGLFRQPGVPAVHLEELYDLQAALGDLASREAFSRMVFPRAHPSQHLEVHAIGTSEHRQVIVRSEITDRRGARFVVREPIAPAEIGNLYRLLRDSDYRMGISELERHLVVTDEGDQVIGGLTYLLQDQDVVYMSGLVVAGSLKGRGIASALLEDFCVRMAARGARLVKVDFLIRHFFTANGFQVDARWGGLVRHLGPPSRNA